MSETSSSSTEDKKTNILDHLNKKKYRTFSDSCEAIKALRSDEELLE